MRVLGWMSLCGRLLLLMALSSASLRRLPVSTSAMYLGVGLAICPLGLGWLRPRGLVPTEDRVAETLGTLLGDVFGRFGYWLMVIGLLTGFYGAVLSNQDGFGRLLANGTRLIRRGQPIVSKWGTSLGGSS
jgi:uncharacterized membrane protein YccF (DUF307 family)